MEIASDKTPAIEGLFSGWEETIIWSCLQGVMGRVYANDKSAPTAAAALLGDFCFLAGQAEGEVLRALKRTVCPRDFLILIPQHEGWSGAIEACYGESCRRVERYAFQKAPRDLDRQRLEGLARNLPEGYELAMLDRRWYSYCARTAWCGDFVSQYGSFEQYEKLGLGVLALRDGVPVSGASSYSSYRSGIEVEVDTREDHRRRGLATVCAARLILECLKRDLYPSWDAQNPWSAALAGKLGYRFSHAYPAYETFL